MTSPFSVNHGTSSPQYAQASFSGSAHSATFGRSNGEDSYTSGQQKATGRDWFKGTLLAGLIAGAIGLFAKRNPQKIQKLMDDLPHVAQHAKDLFKQHLPAIKSNIDDMARLIDKRVFNGNPKVMNLVKQARTWLRENGRDIFKSNRFDDFTFHVKKNTSKFRRKVEDFMRRQADNVSRSNRHADDYVDFVEVK